MVVQWWVRSHAHTALGNTRGNVNTHTARLPGYSWLLASDRGRAARLTRAGRGGSSAIHRRRRASQAARAVGPTSAAPARTSPTCSRPRPFGILGVVSQVDGRRQATAERGVHADHGSSRTTSPRAGCAPRFQPRHMPSALEAHGLVGPHSIVSWCQSSWHIRLPRSSTGSSSPASCTRRKHSRTDRAKR